MKKPNVEFENAKKLISLYLKGQISYGKEIKIAKKLLSIYPIEFFEQYKPQLDIYSLSIFLTPGVKKEISKEYSLFCLMKPKEEIKLEKFPVVSLDFESKTNKKSKNLMEFVDSAV